MYWKKTVLFMMCIMLCGQPLAAGISWSEEKDAHATKMESITVTANKIEEDLQDVPQSITIIDEAVLDEKGINKIEDVVSQIPNMTMEKGTIHGNAMSFRGLNTSIFTNNNPVVLYIDGVATTDRYGFSASLADVKRVEVLRGPQGTLYGKDAIGGVINIVTKMPDNEWHGKIGGEYGSDNHMQVVFNSSGALIDNRLFLGINGQYQQDDGWIQNIHEGMESNADESEDRRISSYLLYTPTERFSTRFTLSSDHTDESWSNGYALPAESDFSLFDRDDAEEVDFDVPTGVENDSLSQSLLMTCLFDSMTLTSTTTHQNMELDAHYDVDFMTNTLYDGCEMFNETEQDTYTQELRLSSNNESGIRWVGGLYFESENRDQNPYGQQFPMYDSTYTTYLGTYEMYSESQTDSLTCAVFGQAMIPLGQRLELTLGGRYQHIDKEIDVNVYYQPAGTNGPAYFSLSTEENWDTFLPKAALSYRLSEAWNTYMSYSQGYMPGGFNYFPTSGTAENNTFDPQQSKNYEIGIKGTLERLRVAVSLFYMEIEDIHVYKSYGNSIYYTDNAESAHSQGIEAEIEYRLSNTIKLTGALGLIHAEYDTYDAGDGISFDGQEIENTPSYTATIGISYAHPNGFYSRADMKAAGEVNFYDDANDTFVKEDAYITFDAKVGYLTGAWDFYVYGKNLTDEEYVVDFISNSAMMMADFGDPLTVGVGIRYYFYPPLPQPSMEIQHHDIHEKINYNFMFLYDSGLRHVRIHFWISTVSCIC